MANKKVNHPAGSRARDAGTGRHVPLKRAETRPKTTVVERPPRKK
jgi:hypothetical protein